MNVLNPAIHGVLDYVLVIGFLLLPGVLGFSDTAALLSCIFGAVCLATSLLTKYPLGALKLIPFPMHGMLEASMAAVWIVSTWFLGAASDAAARILFMISGTGLLLVAALTDYGRERRRAAERRQRRIPVAHDRRMAMSDRRRGGYAGA